MPVRLVTLLALLALAGCGSAGAPVKTARTSVTITLDDFTIRPQQLRVPAGKPLTVTVVNHGRLGHTFRIRGKTRNVLAMTTIRPGESMTRSFKRPLAKGTYTMYCALANHEELGMNGKITIG
jgi:plastocyanin